MKRSETIACLARPAAAYSKEIAEEAVAVWHDALGDLEYEEVDQAMRYHIATSPWFPAPASIRQIVFERRADLPSIEEGVARIMGLVAEGHEARRSLGPVLDSVIDSIGWWRLTSSTDTTTLRAQVRNAYAEAREQAVRELNCASAGLALPPGRRDADPRLGRLASAREILRPVLEEFADQPQASGREEEEDVG